MDNDLLIVVKAKNEEQADKAILKADEFLLSLKSNDAQSDNFKPKSIDGAKKALPDANLVLISVAGKFAFNEAMTALKNNMNVMIFSDNVSIEEELELKNYAEKNNLLVMGPDCGTAIINGVPLAFANSIKKGNIGIVGASGTGIQEISSLIDNFGYGISHAIGTGGRDIKEKIGGISFLKALSMLNEDDETKVILLVSKPPQKIVLDKIFKLLQDINKPIVTVFLGADKESIQLSGNVYFASTLEEGAIKACEFADDNLNFLKHEFLLTSENLQKKATKYKSKLKANQKYLRALYSGGTFCSEMQIVLKKHNISQIYSNAPVTDVDQLEDSLISKMNTVLDLGEDEFTRGKPHPMIDYTLRNQRLLEEAKNPEVAVIVVDLVIGYGANMNPMQEFIPVLKKAKETSPDLTIICFVTGTNKDPQNKDELLSALEKINIEIVYSNAQAAKLASYILE